MTEILKIEFYRLKKSKMFWALFGVTACLPILTIILLLFMASLLRIATDSNGLELFGTLNVTAMLLSSYGSLTATSSLLAVICSSIFLSREFAYGTFRNILLARRTRAELYASFLLISLVIGISFMSASMLTTLVLSGPIFGFASMNAAKITVTIITAFAMGIVSVIFVQTLMCMFLFCTRKLSATLACSIVICYVVPSLLSGIVSFWQTMLIITGSNVSADLSWVPLYNASMLDLSETDGALIGKILLYLIPLSTLFGWSGWWAFRKANLK